MILDERHLSMLRELGDDVVGEIVGVYLHTTPDNLKALSAAVAADDPGTVRREAHSLKGASGNVGAVALSNACRDLEHAAAAGESARIPGLWASVQARYAEARSALEAL